MAQRFSYLRAPLLGQHLAIASVAGLLYVSSTAAAEPEDTGTIWEKGIEFLVSTPELAVTFFIMLLSGTVLSFLFLQGNPKFEKNKDITNKSSFHLAVGFVPGAVVMLAYHGIVHQSILRTLPEFSAAALPSALILAGITSVALFWKIIRP